MSKRWISLSAALLLVSGIAGAATSAGLNVGKLQKAGWDCTAPIGGNVHCTAPGEPTLGDLISGEATPQAIYLVNLTADGSAYVGAEVGIRADLYQDQPCTQDPVGPAPGSGVGPYTCLAIGPIGYCLCHNFDSAF